MGPQAPTSPSQGLMRRAGSVSMGRAPAFNSRVKQSCRLLKCVGLASLKSRSENKRHSAMLPLHTQGCSIWLHQPMKRVTSRRGMRLLNRKLMSSCCVSRPMSDLAFISVSLACNTVRATAQVQGVGDYHDRLCFGRACPGFPAAQRVRAAAAFLGEAPFAGGPCAHVAPLRLLGAVLRIRRVQLFW